MRLSKHLPAGTEETECNGGKVNSKRGKGIPIYYDCHIPNLFRNPESGERVINGGNTS